MPCCIPASDFPAFLRWLAEPDLGGESLDDLTAASSGPTTAGISSEAKALVGDILTLKVPNSGSARRRLGNLRDGLLSEQT